MFIWEFQYCIILSYLFPSPSSSQSLPLLYLSDIMFFLSLITKAKKKKPTHKHEDQFVLANYSWVYSYVCVFAHTLIYRNENTLMVWYIGGGHKTTLGVVPPCLRQAFPGVLCNTRRLACLSFPQLCCLCRSSPGGELGLHMPITASNSKWSWETQNQFLTLTQQML